MDTQRGSKCVRCGGEDIKVLEEDLVVMDILSKKMHLIEKGKGLCYKCSGECEAVNLCKR